MRDAEKKLLSGWVSAEAKAEYELLKTKYAKTDLNDRTSFFEFLVRKNANELKPNGAKIPEGPYVLKSKLKGAK